MGHLGFIVSLDAAVEVVLVQRRPRRILLFQLGDQPIEFREAGGAAGEFLAAKEPVADGPAVSVDAAGADVEAELGPLHGACGEACLLGGLPDVVRRARTGGQELLEKGGGPVAWVVRTASGAGQQLVRRNRTGA